MSMYGYRIPSVFDYAHRSNLRLDLCQDHGQVHGTAVVDSRTDIQPKAPLHV